MKYVSIRQCQAQKQGGSAHCTWSALLFSFVSSIIYPTILYVFPTIKSLSSIYNALPSVPYHLPLSCINYPFYISDSLFSLTSLFRYTHFPIFYFISIFAFITNFLSGISHSRYYILIPIWYILSDVMDSMLYHLSSILYTLNPIPNILPSVVRPPFSLLSKTIINPLLPIL